jgi:hypothetical protein
LDSQSELPTSARKIPPPSPLFHQLLEIALKTMIGARLAPQQRILPDLRPQFAQRGRGAAYGEAVNEHLPLSDWLGLSATEKVAFFTENEIEPCETVAAQFGEEFWEITDQLVVACPFPLDCTVYEPLLSA